MIVLIFFAFVAGIVTILSPCILPVLPILLSGGLTGSKKRPFGIVTGFILSFSFFTLVLSSLVKLIGISADNLRFISIFVVGAFGLTLIIPKLQLYIEILFSKLSSNAKVTKSDGYLGGVLIGISLGLVWTPCVGPILASVITLAATSQVSLASVFITIAYSVGTAIPMIIITLSGRKLFSKVPFLLTNSGKVQQVFGFIMILTAIAIYFNFDRQFQTYILEKFPAYGTNLIKLEDNSVVKNKLDDLSDKKIGTIDSFLKNENPKAPEIIAGGEWINSKPLTIASLKGKVVLIDFWTYTCINCIRTIPYLNDWDEKYRDKGLVIIGVHTPEFEFEKTFSNVEKAIADFGIKYPNVQDNNYATWTAYNNRYWPAKYFIDKNGLVRDTHFGEGGYGESEMLIQRLLAETGEDVSGIEVNNEKYEVNTKTPETYLGYGRIKGFVSKDAIVRDFKTLYSNPDKIQLNTFSFAGYFTIYNEYALSDTGSLLTFSFQSKKVFLVMRPNENRVGYVRILLDGKEVDNTNAGKNVVDGVIKVDADKLYELLDLSDFSQHILQIEFLDANVEAFAFTFG